MEIVREINKAGEKRVYFVGYPKIPPDEMGCENHPKSVAHRQIAEILRTHLKQILGW